MFPAPPQGNPPRAWAWVLRKKEECWSIPLQRLIDQFVMEDGTLTMHQHKAVKFANEALANQFAAQFLDFETKTECVDAGEVDDIRKTHVFG